MSVQSLRYRDLAMGPVALREEFSALGYHFLLNVARDSPACGENVRELQRRGLQVIQSEVAYDRYDKDGIPLPYCCSLWGKK